MKPMLPTLTFNTSKIGNWLYEIKYDGYRGILEWTEQKVHLWSRNGKDLLPQFPEVKSFLDTISERMQEHLPILLDGELVILENPFKANFTKLQQRGRMRSKEKIASESSKWPCHYLLFDLLAYQGNDLTSSPFLLRKNKLSELVQLLELPETPDPGDDKLLQYIPFSNSLKKSLHNMKEFESEGIIEKQAQSKWLEGKRTSEWLKVKNWKTASCFITSMDEKNGYFHVGVWKDTSMFPLGQFLFSLDYETKAALKTTIRENHTGREGSMYFVDPSICVDINYLEWTDNQLREPHFKSLRFDLQPNDCTFEKFIHDEAMFPPDITITHPDKVLWERNYSTKLDYVRYLRKIAPYMRPFLKNRSLTVIRSPHGIFGESFYQKNKPESSPDFIESTVIDDINYIICNDLKSLIWLGNQLAIEFHIPFHPVTSKYVSEIVFDLDPPDRTYFHLAVYAAGILKQILDELGLVSFVKLSGNKGLQVYIPLPENRFTWKDTRRFTSFIAEFLVQYDPESFTTERLKKNRGERLYVDFIQHAEGKTIIAPYSVRNNEDGLVAAPIHWHELTDALCPTQFTMESVLKRLVQMKDPFSSFFHCKDKQPFERVLKRLGNHG
ncbi:DNA ligase D [Siminovitchia terrae]|uniref:DNA ligase (ATP) n=1 Tax=Siminovitchia terrae TaxID=1914933 RepID=A0A429X5L2_SIMTE|nr:DNA ligase D [Siminovitchia terrae]RST58573.1 DNA ligase D [Siminovitchia terrae]